MNSNKTKILIHICWTHLKKTRINFSAIFIFVYRINNQFGKKFKGNVSLLHLNVVLRGLGIGTTSSTPVLLNKRANLQLSKISSLLRLVGVQA